MRKTVHPETQNPRSPTRDRNQGINLAQVRLILDRLAAPTTRNRYPMSALLVAGRAGLEPRGAWTQKIRQAADEADRLDMHGVLGRWYAATSELRLPDDMRRRAGAEAIVKLVVLEDDRTYWVQHDESSRLARPVLPRSDVSRHMHVVQSSERADTYSFDDPPLVEPAGEWVQEHRLLKVALMREPATWAIPPDAPQPGTA